MSQMLDLMRDRIAAGLRKKAISSASKWAEANRIMGMPFPGPWRFVHHPWLREMHDSNAQSNVGQKAAQMGYTETMLNLTFYNIDILRRDCLYVLPAKTPDATDFSASRFGPALELSDYLSSLFSDVQNIGHKRAGAVNLYIRGSKSRSGLKSVPAGFLVMDELDEFEQENIPLAEERQSGQVSRQDWKISTPTIDGVGINKYFLQSTQEHFFFPCPACSRQIELTWPDSVIRTCDDPNHPDLRKTHLICTSCKAVLPHEQKKVFLNSGKWVPTRTDTDVRGFYINQLYSPAVEPYKVASLYLKSLVDQAAEQEFYNSKLGMTHIVDGARITDSTFNECINSHKKHIEGGYPHTGRIITMGVDVGRWLHWEVDEWYLTNEAPYGDMNSYAIPKVIGFGRVPSFGDLDNLMYQFGVHFTVIDANPERRLAYAFVQKHYGRAKMCFYSKGATGRQVVPTPEQDQAISVDRTAWLDMSLGRFQRGLKGIMLPADVDLEYRENLKAQVRVYLKDNDGNPMGKYVTPANAADHYGHARNYAEIALPLALGIGGATDINSPV
jgi:hypothetical protein